MGTVFVANVGSRDVQVLGPANLPKDSRTLGEMILNDWDGLRPGLSLPILGKALDWVLKKYPMLEQIVLFASDQANKQYRHTDTMPFAHVIQRFLAEQYGEWLNRVMRIAPVTENPADYDAMMRFYAGELRRLENSEKVYLEVTGGTPAMSFMLLWQGVEILKDRAQPLYVVQERAMPLSLDIGHRLTTNAVLDEMRRSLSVYQYSAALALLIGREPLLREALPYYTAVCAVVDYARQRMNFNFEIAASALFGAERGLPPELGSRILALADEIARRDERWLLHEEIVAAELDFHNGAYKDAVSNVFAFREGLLRQVAIQSGTHLADKGRKLDSSWLAADTALSEYLESKKIDLTRNVTTFVFERILDYRARQDNDLRDLVDKIALLRKLADLRNDSTHMHGGVAEETIADCYPGGSSAVIKDMQALYERFSGQPIPVNPYKVINQLILELAAL